MEGVFIVIKAWGLCAFLIWVHRRFFERVGRRELAFEARFATPVRLAALYGDAARLSEIATALRALLGKRGRTLATLAGYPWPHYELVVELVRSGKVLTLVATRAELARVHARPAPALVTVLRALIAAQGDAIADHFVAPEMIYETSSSTAALGFRVLAGEEAKPRVAPCAEAPPWLDAPREEVADLPEKSRDLASSADARNAKVLSFSGEC